MSENGFVPSVSTDVNCSRGIYSSASTARRSISDIILLLPLNQSLNRTPPMIVAMPIHSRVIVPVANLPTIVLFETISRVLISGVSMLEGMLDIPFAMAASMISTPPMIENILINDVGVSLPNELNALYVKCYDDECTTKNCKHDSSCPLCCVK